MNLRDLSLLFLRLVVGYIWLKAGFSKLLNPAFINTFPNILESFAKSTHFDFYSNFLNQYIIPNPYIFAQLTTWGETLTGIAFFLGFPMIIATISGIFMNINYFFVATSPPSESVNVVMIFAQLALYANSAGKFWGLETKISKK